MPDKLINQKSWLFIHKTSKFRMQIPISETQQNNPKNQFFQFPACINDNRKRVSIKTKLQHARFTKKKNIQDVILFHLIRFHPIFFFYKQFTFRQLKKRYNLHRVNGPTRKPGIHRAWESHVLKGNRHWNERRKLAPLSPMFATFPLNMQIPKTCLC